MDRVEAWCMRCSCMRMLTDPVVRRSSHKGGRYYAQGTCPVCGSKVNKLIPKSMVKNDEVVDVVTVEPEQPQAVVVAEPPKPRFKGLCRMCKTERPIIGGQVLTHFLHGKVIVDGKCMACGWVGTFLKVVLREEDADAASAKVEEVVDETEF